MKFRIFLILTLFVAPAVAQQSNSKVEDCGAIDFRFLLAWNKVTGKGRESRARTLYFYMDATDVHEANLRKLFQWVSKTYPVPRTLYVTVKTKLAELPNPTESDCEGDGDSNVSEDYLSGTVWATYVRSAAAEWFNYVDDPQSQAIRSVDIRRGRK